MPHDPNMQDFTTLENGTGLLIGGLVPFSTVDWPGKLAAVVFTSGCPWDCPYCHNPHLLGRQAVGGAAGVAAIAEEPGTADTSQSAPAWAYVLALLDARAGLLDGVVFSGGEPTAQPALAAAIQTVRARGFEIALHTNGAYPERLRTLLPLVDWVGLDIKAPRAIYDRIARVPGAGERAFESLARLIASGVRYEVRTTLHPDLLGDDELSQLADELEAANVPRWAIQAYRAEGVRPGLPSVRVTPATLPARVRDFRGELVFRDA